MRRPAEALASVEACSVHQALKAGLHSFSPLRLQTLGGGGALAGLEGVQASVAPARFGQAPP